MKFWRLSWAAAVIAALILSSGCVRKRDSIPIEKSNTKDVGKLYLIPLGGFPAEKAHDLASFYQNKYGLRVETLPNVNLTPTAINPERKQLIAEEAVEIMKRANPNLKNDPNAILIGLTIEDMYIAKLNWRFSFSFRDQGKYAVVSCGRMVLPQTGRFKLHPASEELILSRLRKMVTKNIGILFYHLPQSDNPQSVLYRNVDGIEELDRMGEDF